MASPMDAVFAQLRDELRKATRRKGPKVYEGVVAGSRAQSRRSPSWGSQCRTYWCPPLDDRRFRRRREALEACKPGVLPVRVSRVRVGLYGPEAAPPADLLDATRVVH